MFTHVRLNLAAANAPVMGQAVGNQFDQLAQPQAENLDLRHFVNAISFLADQFPDANGIVVGF